MATTRLTQHDITDTSMWETGEIPYKGANRKVRFLPSSRKKLALDEETKDFLWYNRDQEVWHLVRHGLYALRRMLRHMEHTHAQELPTLEQVEDACRELGLTFIDLNVTNVKSHGAKIAQARLQAFIDALGNVLNQDKVDAKEQLTRIIILDYRDSKGRVNSGVVMCRTATAADRLQQRINSIRSMDAWITFYGAIVERLIAEVEHHLREAKRYLDLFITWVYKEDFRMTNTKRVQYYFDEYQHHVDRLALKPYLRAAKHLREEITKILTFAREGRFIREAAIEGTNSLMSLLLLSFRSPFERIKLHLRRASEGFNLTASLEARIIVELMTIEAQTAKVNDEQFKQPIKERLLAATKKARAHVAAREWKDALEAVDTCLNMI